MKKACLILTVLASVLTGCSKVGIETSSDPNAWVLDDSLPVPVLLGTPGAGMMTKAGFDGTSLPDSTKIGIIGLEYGNEGWTYMENTSESVLINNNAYAIVDAAGNLTLDKARYYPLTGNQNFVFYGFYPYGTTTCFNAGAEESNSYYTVSYTIDGKTDVLWAEAIAPDLVYTNEDDGKKYKATGYNAAYIRKVMKYAETDEKDDYMPNLNFEHKLTALDFKLRAYEDAWTELETSQVKVTGLTIVQTSTKARMVIASLDQETAETGSLTGDTPGDIPMEGVTETTLYGDGSSTYQDAEFGDGMLLVPSDKYMAQLEMTYIPEGETETRTCYADLTFKLPDGKSFEAGKRYTLTIIIKAPQEVIATASLTEWDVVGDEIIIDQMNDISDEEYTGN